MPKAKVVIELNQDQANLLQEILLEHTDEGPAGEGWASPKLCELREVICTACSTKTRSK